MAGMGDGGRPTDGIGNNFSVTNLGNDYKVISLEPADSLNSLGEKVITAINFYNNIANYCADISADSIKLSDRDMKKDIVEFDMNKKKLLWYLDHKCNPDNTDGNVIYLCQACKDPKLDANFWNGGILSFYGRSFEGRKYSKKLSKELVQLLSKDIPEYMQRFYDFCKSSPTEPSKHL